MTCSFIGWCALDGEVQAAWVQAVLSVFALAVAILIPYLQHRADRKERDRDRRARQKAMALAVLPDLAYVERSIGSFYDHAYDSEVDHLRDGSLEGLVAVPTSLKAHTTVLHELGDASDVVTGVVASLTRARDTFLEWRDSPYATAHPKVLEARVHQDLREASRRAKEAIEELYRLFDP